MLATLVLLLLAVTFFEAVSRSGTPHEARRPLGSLTVRDHLVAAWAGLVLLTRTHQRGRAVLGDRYRPEKWGAPRDCRRVAPTDAACRPRDPNF